MKKNLFLITEEEKNRILGMHMKATKSQYLSEQEVPATPAPAATTPATPAPAANTEQAKILTFNDRDYAYKKEGDKYFFKLQANPASAKAQGYKTSGKFLNWTEAKGNAAGEIAKLNFKPETMATASVVNTKVTKASEQTPTIPTTAQTAAPVKPLATGGGSQTTTQQVTAQTNPEIAQDLKSAAQIRQEFRQGKRDLRKLQKEREKLYNTYNRLSDKMDKATSDSYLNNISQLDQLISQK
jgi:hypothetical protein